ncbi:hypothetical protein BDA99DRAFT_137820 [Phascolomyces articulosus]|uniref:Uncharacterized protein n=1 Tax=Phascolomyces articulosus TaxID=60185 RepID=A0AAD5JWM1_9FUNG|nr:hypothetical protein BDA99DRAFT_137820 [Phascolomyces articulosus]
MASITNFNLSEVSKRHLSIAGSTVVLFSLYSLYQRWVNNGSQEIDCPIVPYTNPMVGSTYEYNQDPQGFVEKYRAELGPVFRVRIFGRLQTVVSDSYIREIFFNENFSFSKGLSRRIDIRLLTGMIKGDTEDGALRTIIVKFLTMRMKKYTPRAVHYI